MKRWTAYMGLEDNTKFILVERPPTDLEVKYNELEVTQMAQYQQPFTYSKKETHEVPH